MNILFLTHYFPPEVNAPATRTYEHCKQWVKNGHEVTVVTCAPNHPKGQVYPGYKNKLYQKESIDGITVIRLWTYVTANEGFVKRTLNYISYMVSVIFAIPFLPKSDIVVSTSPQFFCGLAGYFVKLFKRIPWVLEIRDLWPESIIAVGAVTNKTIVRILEYIELKAYQKSDHIVVVTDAFKKFIVAKGINSEKITIIKNGVDLSFYKPEEIEAKDVFNLKLDSRFVASYFGTHGMAHHLETVLEAAEILSERDDIVFVLVGDGAEKQTLLEIKNQKNLSNVIMLDQQGKDKMPNLWALSGVSLVLLKKSDLFKTVIPSKIFESMAMKKPIILGVEGEVKGMIEEGGSGICIEPESATQLAESVIMIADDIDLNRKLGENGRRYVEAYFDRTVLAERFEKIMADLSR
jgi:glycosyltransferase involved in cell wall biosynthesis